MHPSIPKEISKFRNLCIESLIPITRIHNLPFEGFSENLYVKREDECGFSLSGLKKRKYASLIKWLLQSDVKVVGVIGGLSSNNVVGLCQILLQNRIKPILFLREGFAKATVGNPLLSCLLVPNESRVLIPREKWKSVEKIAEDHLKQLYPDTDQAVVIPEGANTLPSIPGCVTLLEDILVQELKSGLKFKQIFIEAGTGLTAASLIVANSLLPEPKEIHVLLLALKVEHFELELHTCYNWFEQICKFRIPRRDTHFLHYPEKGKSFGSVSTELIQEIKFFASEFGILTDPIYSGKLFSFVRANPALVPESEKGLVIHSGGLNALNGFGERFLAQE